MQFCEFISRLTSQYFLFLKDRGIRYILYSQPNPTYKKPPYPLPPTCPSNPPNLFPSLQTHQNQVQHTKYLQIQNRIWS
jgi:hypothetical protein